jgi:hypothetical protein
VGLSGKKRETTYSNGSSYKGKWWNNEKNEKGKFGESMP